MTSRTNKNPMAMMGRPATDAAEAAMNEYVGDRIRTSRINRGYCVDELAVRTGLNPRELGAMEAGLGRVRASELVAIANALGVHLGALFGARSPMGEAAGTTAPTESAQPSGEAARIARAYDLIRDPLGRNILLTLSELLAHGSETVGADGTH